MSNLGKRFPRTENHETNGEALYRMRNDTGWADAETPCFHNHEKRFEEDFVDLIKVVTVKWMSLPCSQQLLEIVQEVIEGYDEAIYAETVLLDAIQDAEQEGDDDLCTEDLEGDVASGLSRLDFYSETILELVKAEDQRECVQMNM